MVEQVEVSRSRPVEIAFYREPSYMEDPQSRTEVRGAKAFVTIMQGSIESAASASCPTLRGREVAGQAPGSLPRLNHWLRQGVREVMLLGQNVNSYGKTSPANSALPSFSVESMAIDGLERIRFTTSHPQDLSPELIDAFASSGQALRASALAGAVRRGFGLVPNTPRLHTRRIFRPD